MIASIAFVSATAAESADFRGLGDLPGEDFHSQAFGVSATGAVVVGISSALPGAASAFRWTSATGMQAIGDEPNLSDIVGSLGYAVSDDGLVVVGNGTSPASAGNSEAFRWTQAGGIQPLGDFAGGLFASSARAVSADGSVLVGSGHVDAGPQAMYWTAAEGLVGLGDLPGGNFASVALDVSADGSVIVGFGWSAQASLEAFRWTAAGGLVPLGLLGGTSSYATGVSADGSVVVGHASLEGFRWTAELGMQGIGDLPGGAIYSDAEDVSADGNIVVGNSASATSDVPGSPFGTDPIVWDAVHGMRNLRTLLANEGIDTSAWGWLYARAISDDGRVVVGVGSNPSGATEAWRAVLGPIRVACDDGVDNDGDGFVDLDDPGCPLAAAIAEDPPCDNGQDDDADGAIDFGDPDCDADWPFWEARPCGLGAELPLVLVWLHARRRRAAVRRHRDTHLDRSSA